MKNDRMWRCSLCGWQSAHDASACALCEKRKPRAKRAKPPPALRPWRAVILAVDAGSRSGWAVWVLGELVDSGELAIYTNDGVSEVARIVERARVLAGRLGVPWCAMIEAAWGGRMKPGKSGAGGYWTFALRAVGLPYARIGMVYPATWRARTLGDGMHAAERAVVRAREVVVASAIAGCDVGPDEAPAILIGRWAACAGEVGLLLPKKSRVTICI